MAETLRQHNGLALILGGPHGAGKDTLANLFAAQESGTARIVRHITRPPAPEEVDGVDYHFVDTYIFTAMAGNDEFLEYDSFPGVMSGTSKVEVESKLEVSRFATLTANFEDGLSLHRQLRNRRIASLCFFVSPCTEETMINSPQDYKDILLRRMISRGRGTDHIEGRLIMAEKYRRLYIKNRGETTYINNADNKLHKALAQVTQAALAYGFKQA
jgi:guanylate kinase